MATTISNYFAKIKDGEMVYANQLIERVRKITRPSSSKDGSSGPA